MQERRGANCGVAEAACVAKERVKTDCGVAEAGCEAKERIVTFGGVLTGIAAVRWWDNRFRRRRKRKAGEREKRERRTRSVRCYFHVFISFHLRTSDFPGPNFLNISEHECSEQFG
jgi:hypothetical protein